MARNQHNWSEAVKSGVIAAVEAGMTQTEAGKIYGVPLPTVNSWMSGAGVNSDVLQKAEDVKKELADKLEAIAHQIIDAAPGKIEKANLLGGMTALGIAVDKMRLLREQPTSITVATLSIEERVARVSAELAALGFAVSTGEAGEGDGAECPMLQ